MVFNDMPDWMRPHAEALLHAVSQLENATPASAPEPLIDLSNEIVNSVYDMLQRAAVSPALDAA